MWFRSLIDSLIRPHRRCALRAAKGKPTARRLFLEGLEDRRLLAFIAPVDYAVGTSPVEIVTGDFNNDGKLDLATANYPGMPAYSGGSLSVLLGDGQGGFGAANHLGGDSFRSLAVGDFNKDGNLDLAAVDDFDWVISVLLGNGAGGFVWANNGNATQGQPQSVAVGDFNADGNMDLVCTSINLDGIYEGHVEVLLGDGHGDFTSPQFISIGYPTGLAIADLNADGKPDVVVAHELAKSLTVLLGNGDGTLSYTPGASYFATGNNTRSVAVGEFNGDGIPDLLAGGYTKVAVLPGNGDGMFGSPISQLTNNSDQMGVATADFNGDGKLDVVTADGGEGTVTALLGVGNGILTLVGELAAGSSTRAVTVGDFNGDGRPDVAAANAGSNTVAVLLNDGAWPDDLNTPWLRIDDVTVTEGNTGTTTVTFTVDLSIASTHAVTVNFATANGSATAGGDYQAASGTLTFAPGETSKNVTVLVNGDRLGEPTETFLVNLSNPTNATIGDGQGVGAIMDDEPRISISDASKAEGRKGKTTLFTFTVTLSAAYDQPVTMSFRTVNGTATTSDSDYIAKSGTLTFAPGETTKTITIEVKGDSKREANETFYLDLFGNSSNSQLTKNRGLGTILNDD